MSLGLESAENQCHRFSTKPVITCQPGQSKRPARVGDCLLLLSFVLSLLSSFSKNKYRKIRITENKTEATAD